MLGTGLLFVLLFQEIYQVSSISVTLNDVTAIRNSVYFCGTHADIVCTIHDTFHGSQVQWVKYTSTEIEIITKKPILGQGGFLDLSLPLSHDGSGEYSCQYNDPHLVTSPKYAFNITIYTQGGSSCNSSATPTISSTPTSTISSTPTSSTIGTHFPGLNPLIYTIISAFLLCMLILVSIITCWIRSRKNARLRALLPQETPQDYLDYIQQGQFTPLTTSEFIASLRERPPTYNESEVIQQQLSEDVSTSDSPPPPLPPRNSSTRFSPVEEEGDDTPREPLGNLNTSEGVVDHTPVSTSESTLPNLFPEDFTLSFLLHESDTLQQTFAPPNNEEDSEEESSETTNLMVGVIPSINNAVV